MTTSKLRRPNFNLSLRRQSNDDDLNLASASASAHFRSVGSGNPIGSVSSTTTTTSAQSLANYTRQCHKRLASSILPNHEVDARGSEQDHHQSNATSASLPTTGEVDVTNINSKNNNDTTPNLEQCILLLEPILDIFQKNCVMNDKAKRKQKHRQGSGSMESTNAATRKSGVQEEEEEKEDEDEIPPQLLRAAKFFPYRFIPMKRALLRPPPPPPSPPTASSCTSNNNHDHSKNETRPAASDSADVELSLHYRLRLVRACWKRGLVAAAEYETLQKSLERTTSKKRKGCNNTDEKNDEIVEEDGYNTNNLMERVRLSFLRLPTEAIHPHRSTSAWNHVKEMITQCCALWEDEIEEEEEDMKKPVLDDGRPKNDVKRSISPDQVADWAMTSWTAILLLRGLDCAVAPPLASSNQHRDKSISSIERQLATMLTNRSTSSDTNSPALDLARAVESRINILLRPENIESLNGIHIYSLGRLLASFHNRDDAILHIAKSVCQCAIGRGGTMGLEQLARLVAVYLCCISSSTSPTSMDANHWTNTSSIVRDVEAILGAKLGDYEFLKTIVEAMDYTTGGVMQHSPSSVKLKATSFLEAVLSTTAHLVKCCE